MGIPIGEALVATTGITAAIRPGPVHINQDVLWRAFGLEKTVQRKLRRFVRSKELAELADPPDFDFEEVAGLLPGASQEARNVENVSRFQDQALAAQYAQVLGHAIGYAQAMLPAETLPGSPGTPGTKDMTPSDLDVSEFRRRYLAIDKPLAVLDDLCAGPIVPDQVEALSEVLPGLYAFMKETLFREMVDAAAAKTSFQLPYDKDQALQVFLQTDTLTPELHAELTKTFEAARERESGTKADGSPSNALPRKGIGDPSTMQERLEAK